MATLNGEPVSVNDRVYDISKGGGIVIELAYGEIRVQLDDGSQTHYDSEGNQNGKRFLYWHNPVVIDPPRNETKWVLLKSILETIKNSQMFRNFTGSAD